MESNANEMAPLAERLRGSRQYKHLIEQQYANARYNLDYHRRKAAEIEREIADRNYEHQLEMLEAEEHWFIERIKAEGENGDE
jgi:hypothetical protein